MSNNFPQVTLKAWTLFLENRFNRFAGLPIPLFLGAMIVLWFAALPASHESQALMMACNFIFSTVASTMVVVLAGLTFLARGNPGLLMLGCGALLWGAAGTIGPGLLALGSNVTITVHNILVCIGALCNLSGVLLSLKIRRPPKLPGLVLAITYGGAFCLAWLVAMLTIADLLPVFFIHGQGGTMIRSLTLGSAIAMFGCTSTILWWANRPLPSAFSRWYAAALLLIATGLLGILFERVHGGALSWTGRAAQFLGGGYMVLAAIAALRESGMEGLSFSAELREAKQIYRTLVDLSPEAIVVHTEGKYIFVNPAALRLFGAIRQEDLIGRDVLSLIHPDDRECASSMLATQEVSAGSVKQVRVLRLDGQPINVEAAYARIEFQGRPAMQVFLRDISERKQAEFAVIHAKEQWEHTFDSVPDLIAILDDRHQVIRANLAMARKLGCTPKECIGKSCFDIVHGSNAPPDICPHAQTLKDGKEHTAELHDDLLGGYFLVTTTPLTDKNGRIIGSVHVARDINELKQSKDALHATNEDLRREITARKQSEEQLQVFIEHAPASLAMLDHDMRYLSVSRRWLSDYNLGDRELRGQSHYEIFPETPERWKEIHRRALAGFIIRDDNDRFDRADGSAQILRWEVRPWYDTAGQVAGIVIFSEDITERTHTQEALHRSEARFKLLSETAEQLIMWKNIQVVVNDLCRKTMTHLDCHIFFNYFVKEKTGRLHLNAYAGIPDEEARKIEWLDFGVDVYGCAALDAAPIVENISTTPDPLTELVKSYGILAYACHPLMVQGKAIGTLSFGTMTRTSFSDDDQLLMKRVAAQVATAMERSRLIDELQQSRDELEFKVQERTADLEKMIEALRQSNIALEDFAHVASHDLQEPLRKIRTFAERVATMKTDSMSDQERDYLTRMQQAAARMQSLIQELVKYSRVVSSPEPFRVINLKAPAEDAIKDLIILIEENEGCVEIDELPDVEANATQMRQLFQNLISNALKYRSNLKPLIKIYCSSASENGFHEIHVKDNGIGFDEIYLDKIFKPFQRLHGKSSPYQGTGMGLAICNKILEYHGGNISAKSEPGNGSTFILRLPVVRTR